MSIRLGRPPVDNPKSERLHIRVTPSEKKKIKDFCNYTDNLYVIKQN